MNFKDIENVKFELLNTHGESLLITWGVEKNIRTVIQSPCQ